MNVCWSLGNWIGEKSESRVKFAYRLVEPDETGAVPVIGIWQELDLQSALEEARRNDWWGGGQRSGIKMDLVR